MKNGEGNVWVVVVVVDVRKKKRMAARSKPTASSLSPHSTCTSLASRQSKSRCWRNQISPVIKTSSGLLSDPSQYAHVDAVLSLKNIIYLSHIIIHNTKYVAHYTPVISISTRLAHTSCRSCASKSMHGVALDYPTRHMERYLVD